MEGSEPPFTGEERRGEERRGEEDFSKISREKETVFVSPDAFSYNEWIQLEQKLKSIDEENYQAQRAKAFAELFLNTYTTPPQEGQQSDAAKHVSIFTIIRLFEHSFDYFKEEVSEEEKNKILDIQFNLMEDTNIPEEARNAMKGIWGYFADPDRTKKIQEVPEKTSEYAIRQDYAQSVRKYREPYEQKPALLQKLTPEHRILFYLVDDDFKSSNYKEGDEFADAVTYFATLYETDAHPLESEPGEKVVFHQLANGSRTISEGVQRETGQRMPSHNRIYFFEKNRLPSNKSLTEGTARLCITHGATDTELEHISGDILPNCILLNYVSRLRTVKYTDEYKDADDDTKIEIRRRAVTEFISELMDFTSTLWTSIDDDGSLSAGEKQNIQQTLQRYQSEIQTVLLGVMVDINPSRSKTQSPRQ